MVKPCAGRGRQPSVLRGARGDLVTLRHRQGPSSSGLIDPHAKVWKWKEKLWLWLRSWAQLEPCLYSSGCSGAGERGFGRGGEWRPQGPGLGAVCGPKSHSLRGGKALLPSGGNHGQWGSLCGPMG